MTLQWYVLRVASGHEDRVRRQLEARVKAKALEERIPRILVPIETVTEMRGGKRRNVKRKLYPGYVLVECDLDEETRILIRETPGVGDFIGPAGKPTAMSSSDVDKMLMQVEKAQEGAPVSVEFEKGDMVKIKEGAFENFEGEVDDVLADKGLIRVIVTIFGRATPVELEYWQVEKT